MPISRQEVAKVASLARLALSDDELDRMTSQLGSIVGFVSQLEALDTAGVESLAHPGDAANVFRDDVVQPSLSTGESLRSAPRHDGECFLVPAVLGDSGAA
jgi:aspartyl-tRNA(Asn)/glutamyl-tRNA(Gln) amidotransferase subunit C